MAEFESLSKENYENFYWSSNLSHQRVLKKKKTKLIISMKIILAKIKHKTVAENLLYYLITWYV